MVVTWLSRNLLPAFLIVAALTPEAMGICLAYPREDKEGSQA